MILIPRGAYSRPTSGYWLALAYIVEKTIEPRKRTREIKRRSTMGCEVPKRITPRDVRIPGTKMKIFLLLNLSDNRPPIGPPNMLANMIRDAMTPDMYGEIPKVSFVYASRKLDDEKIDPQRPRTPNAISQMLRFLNTGFMDRRFAGATVRSRGITTCPIRTEIIPISPPRINPCLQPSRSVTSTHPNRPNAPPMLKQLL